MLIGGHIQWINLVRNNEGPLLKHASLKTVVVQAAWQRKRPRDSSVLAFSF